MNKTAGYGLFFLWTLVLSYSAARFEWSRNVLWGVFIGSLVVFVAAHDLPRGTRLTTDSVIVTYWPAADAPPSAPADWTGLIGKIASADIPRWHPILSENLAP